MLCRLCWFMLRGQEHYQWRGSFDLNFEHHKSVGSLRAAANDRCRICMALRDEFPHHLSQRWYHDEKPLSITSGLCRQPLRSHESVDAVYRLDFRLSCDSFRGRRTFILKDISNLNLNYRTDISNSTSSDEVFSLARQWMRSCRCVDLAAPRFYPKRLLTWLDDVGEDLDRQEEENNKEGHFRHRSPGPRRIRLVETKDWQDGKPPGHKVQYVTLSHCWGLTTVAEKDKLLSRHRIRELKGGVETKSLRKTFSEAIRFASRIEEVGYIWIDCFCILQGREEVYDWLSQSGEMDRVYGSSYLNLSATSASSDDGGIFFDREHRLLWEDEINLDTADIPKPRGPDMAVDHALALGDNSEIPDLSRCVLLDASFWDKLIEEAPVNTRGWVLQERIMARRVLHFCRNQIAWECCEFETAEAYPSGLSMYRLKSDEIIDHSILRRLSLAEGQALRLARLHHGRDPDDHLGKRIYIFELWKNIAEVYSKTSLTNPGDKLVALSGIARRIALRFASCGSPIVYHAGLWRPEEKLWSPYLASQLLWRVELKIDEHTGLVWHLSTRPREYRAPSFCWASLDTDKGRGIVCGDVTDQNILIKIMSIDVAPRSKNHIFGMVENDGSIVIRGKLRRINLFLLEKSSERHVPGGTSPLPHQHACTGRVGWTLQGRSKELQADVHANTYLDCLGMDMNEILNSTRTYCLPVARGDRINGEDDIIALLLVEAQGHGSATFRRIGLTKISSWADELTHRHILDVDKDADAKLACMKFFKRTGRHQICII